MSVSVLNFCSLVSEKRWGDGSRDNELSGLLNDETLSKPN